MSTKSKSSTSPFPKWPKSVHDATGDYRIEAEFLESTLHRSASCSPISNNNFLYKHQSKIPHLPIPSVSETLSKFVPTALPLAESIDEKTSFLQAVERFPSQVSKLQLQERLEQRKNVEYSNSSWLQHWWNIGGYLQPRDPITINANYYYHFQPDPTLPTSSIENDDVDLSIVRGATILYKLAELRKEVCSATLPPPYVGKPSKPTYLCNAQYKYMFHTCRIPQYEQDCIRMYDPSEHSHCIVAYKGHYFAVHFIEAETQDPLPLCILERRLQRVKELVDLEEQDDLLQLGWLTSWNRDLWAKGRDLLISVGGSDMKRALSKLESGAFLLCLDDEEPVSRNQCATQFLHGAMHSGYNRWFDKSLQFIITKNGQAGMNGEHAMMDGMPTVHIAGIVAGTYYQDIASEQVNTKSSNNDGVHDIFASCYKTLARNANVQKTIQNAKDDFDSFTNAHEIQVKKFYGYGSDFMKSSSFSPDAYAQMAMQLATYRLFQKQVGTYEATQVRVFKHGRTEVTRAVSLESEAFVKAMGLYSSVKKHSNSANLDALSKLNLLRKATDGHVNYLRQASKGLGVDRHLMGLSMCIKDGESSPDLFTHPLFLRSKTWRVSTSHLTHPHFMNWGYGEVVPNGVGLSYSVHKDNCTFSITALKEHGWTEKLADLLEDALIEMQAIIDIEKGQNMSKSKL